MPAILQFESVSKYIGELVLFEEISFTLNQGEKSALIGLNGTGKTTLLNSIIGKDHADKGAIQLHKGTRIGYLPQEPDFPHKLTVMEALFNAENGSIQCIKNYEESILSQDIALIEHSTLQMDRLKLWDYENRIKQMLTQLDITDFHQKIEELSGGQLKRVALANTLLNEPDLLLLDEPTNHLDLPVIEWLENYIRRSAITLLMVTHDRYFLDRICNVIFEIDQKKLYRYNGNFSRFIELREHRIETEKSEVERAQNLLRKEEDWMSRMPKARSTKAKYRIDNYYALKEKAGNSRNEQSIKINVRETRLGSKIMVAKNLNFSWNNTCYLKNFSYTFSRFEKIGMIGKNGSGKTTLLEVLTQAIQPENGTIDVGETIKIGYYRQEGINFDENMKVLDAVTDIAETVAVADGSRITVSQFLNYFLFPYNRQHDFIYKLSGGEKRRLYLCQVLMQNPNFLILDEPTNDLDIASLQVLEDYLADFKGCLIVVTHDRYFMDSIVDHLFVLDGSGEVKDFPGNYSDYTEWKKENSKIAESMETKKVREATRSSSANTKISYKEKKELDRLEKEIHELEMEKAGIEEMLNGGSLSLAEITEKSKRLGILIQDLEEKSDRWLELSDK
jgi:ABC transport system ATP-binding/permease protein